MTGENERRTPVRREDYRPPSYLVRSTELTFELEADCTRVTTRLALIPGPGTPGVPVRLDGRDLELVSVRIDEKELTDREYERTPEALILPAQPEPVSIEIVTLVHPSANTALMGLYASESTLLTQCEPEGFRRITYYPDRPDVLATFTCTMIADAVDFPLLLANGNQVDGGPLPDGRHWKTWVDPHPKPSYLFAMVAGSLGYVEDRHRTPSGRTVTVRVYAPEADLPRCGHALEASKKALTWDEERFGLEYDLDNFNVVAVPDFTMGAMENKGLNIFNSRFVLVDPQTATDEDFIAVERVIAHEYFHNWTGNRVTCRDVFQLSLKEGLAVYRDEEFVHDMGSRGAQRVLDVAALRENQFTEDMGPRAHSVRPDEYEEISNFFTWTVYKKGSEIVRMLATVLGAEGFRRGLHRYLTRHDGQAVTCEDFVAALDESGGRDLSGFLRWYSQAGTPLVTVRGEFDPAAKQYTLVLRQSHPPTPNQPEKRPLPIPVTVALLGEAGQPLPLRLEQETEPGATERVFLLRDPEMTLTFVDVTSAPVPSLLRRLSAPVRLDSPLTARDRIFLAQHDDDSFVRWDAIQSYAIDLLLARYKAAEAGPLPDDFLQVLEGLLSPAEPDPAAAALMLELPSEGVLVHQLEDVDPVRLSDVRLAMRSEIAQALQRSLVAAYHRAREGGAYVFSPEAVGRRRLVAACLQYLAHVESDEVTELLREHYRSADNMTDTLAALVPLSHRTDGADLLAEFGQRWRNAPLELDKWFTMHAESRAPHTLERVTELRSHPAFSHTNPNRVAALVMAFCFENSRNFHAIDGSGYAFAVDQITTLDGINQQVAARLTNCFATWQKLEPQRRELVGAALRRIQAQPGLSRETLEIVTKLLS